MKHQIDGSMTQITVYKNLHPQLGDKIRVVKQFKKLSFMVP